MLAAGTFRELVPALSGGDKRKLVNNLSGCKIIMLYIWSKILSISLFVITFLLLGLILFRSIFPDKHISPNTHAETYAETLQENKRDNGNKEETKTFWQRTLSEPIVLYTFALAVLTCFLVITSAFQIAHLIRSNVEAAKAAAAAEKAANAAIASNEISREIMVAEQRPWVAVDVDIAGSLAYDDKDWDAGVRWHIPLKYTMRNIGKTPATNVSFFAEVIPFVLSHRPADKIRDGEPYGIPTPGTDVTKEIESICGFPEKMSSHNMGWGKVLFPGEETGGVFGLNGNPGRFVEIDYADGGYTGQFLIIVCTSYGSTYTDSFYRTAKSFNLYKRTGDSMINLSGEHIPLDALALAQHPDQKGSQAK